MKSILKSLFPLLFLFLLLACKDEQKLKAKIFERKEVEDNRLMIKYKYNAKGRSFIDSATIKNIVIANDSINVIIDPANPGKASPQLTK